MDMGRIKWFSELDGYGFIEHIDGRDIYFHYTAVAGSGPKKTIALGSKVYFDILDTATGFEASNVKILGAL